MTIRMACMRDTIKWGGVKPGVWVLFADHGLSSEAGVCKPVPFTRGSGVHFKSNYNHTFVSLLLVL